MMVLPTFYGFGWIYLRFKFFIQLQKPLILIFCWLFNPLKLSQSFWWSLIKLFSYLVYWCKKIALKITVILVSQYFNCIKVWRSQMITFSVESLSMCAYFENWFLTHSWVLWKDQQPLVVLDAYIFVVYWSMFNNQHWNDENSCLTNFYSYETFNYFQQLLLVLKVYVCVGR